MVMTGVASRFAFFDLEFDLQFNMEFNLEFLWWRQVRIQGLVKQQTLTTFGDEIRVHEKY